MTTKPKTRKAPAAKAAPKAAPKEAAAEPKREESEIGALVSRWGWLAADMAYKAATAPTEKENEAAFQIHTDEQMTIETKLAGLVPENFGDVCDLLEFATQKADEGGRDGLKIGMLRNARSGLSVVWQILAVERRIDKEAERAEGAAEAHPLEIDEHEP